MRFQMHGKGYEVSREDVESRLRDLQPDPIQQLAVRVLDQWWPVKQAYGAVMRKDNSQFNSRRAFDIFRRLGFEVHDVKQDGSIPHESPQSPAAENRIAALSLAVTLNANAGRSAQDVMADANAFVRWLNA